MKILEYVGYVLKPVNKMPRDIARNFDYDAALIQDLCGCIPDVLRARNGNFYVYFEDMDMDKFAVLRQMGFDVRLHKSHRYYPRKFIYRARINKKNSKIAGALSSARFKDIVAVWESPAYKQYVANYKKTKTK